MLLPETEPIRERQVTMGIELVGLGMVGSLYSLRYNEWTGLPVAGVACFCVFTICLSMAITFGVSIGLGRFQGADGVTVLQLPWVTDTFEMHPESGVATVLLGGTSLWLVLTIYAWHLRCDVWCQEPTQEHRRMLSASAYVVALSFLTYIFMLGTVGFKSSGLGGLSPVVKSACGILLSICSTATLAGVSFIEWRAKRAHKALSAFRAYLLFACIGLLMASAATIELKCPGFSISNAGDTVGCLSVSLTEECLPPSPLPENCDMAPTLYIAYVGHILIFFLTLAASLRGWRLRMVVITTAKAPRPQEHDEITQVSAQEPWMPGEETLSDIRARLRGVGGGTHIAALGAGRGARVVQSNAATLSQPSSAPLSAGNLGLLVGAQGNGWAGLEGGMGGGEVSRSWDSVLQDTMETPGVSADRANGGRGLGEFERAYLRLMALREERILPDMLIATVEGILYTIEEDEKHPDESVFAERLSKLFLSYAKLSRHSRRVLRDSTMSKRTASGEPAPPVPDPQHRDALREQQQQHGHREGSGDIPTPTRSPPAWVVMGTGKKAVDRWREFTVPTPAELSEFDPVSPAVTLEQRRRLMAAKRSRDAQMEAMGKPRTAQEAWESHMRAMGISIQEDGGDDGDGSPPPAEGPKLAAKLAREVQ